MKLTKKVFLLSAWFLIIWKIDLNQIIRSLLLNLKNDKTYLSMFNLISVFNENIINVIYLYYIYIINNLYQILTFFYYESKKE